MTMTNAPTYKITRFRFEGEPTTIKRDLTLAEAQAHCQREDTHGEGWVRRLRRGRLTCPTTRPSGGQDDESRPDRERRGGGPHGVTQHRDQVLDDGTVFIWDVEESDQQVVDGVIRALLGPPKSYKWPR